MGPCQRLRRRAPEGGEGGRPHRCFRLLPGTPPRALGMARTQVWPRRPGGALTCRSARTARVDSAQQVLRRGREWAGGGNIVCMRVHTGMQGGPGLSHSAPLMPLSVPRASCDTARHMRSMCGVLRDGAAGRLGQARAPLQCRNAASAKGRSRCICRADARRARLRCASGVRARAGQLCSGMLRLLRTAFPSQNMPRQSA